MSKILIAGIDPGFRNFGVARLRLDLDSLDMEVDDLILMKTESGTGGKQKVIRKNSDDLRRAIEQNQGFRKAVEGCAIGFAEIPSGAQDHRAAMGFGISIGIIACSPIPILQVQNFEAKLAAVGTKTASKDEMIEWAMELYPDAPWLRYERNFKTKKKGEPKDENEHLADGIAIAKAGIGLQEFQQLKAVWKATAIAA
jgi:Holliday junction resolvasome RuvABC endonuclease subunit